MAPRIHYAVLLFQGFQALDVFGPLDPLNLLARKHPITLSLIGPSLSPVSTLPPTGNPSGSLFSESITPTHTYTNPPSNIDVLIIPGGSGVLHEPTIAPVINLTQTLLPTVRTVFTVCTGSHVLARTGHLDGKRATTNKVRFKRISALSPEVQWVRAARWIVEDEGRVWTSSGVSAGIDAMLAFLEGHYGTDQVRRLATVMEFLRAESAEDDPFEWAVDAGLDI